MRSLWKSKRTAKLELLSRIFCCKPLPPRLLAQVKRKPMPSNSNLSSVRSTSQLTPNVRSLPASIFATCDEQCRNLGLQQLCERASSPYLSYPPRPALTKVEGLLRALLGRRLAISPQRCDEGSVVSGREGIVSESHHEPKRRPPRNGVGSGNTAAQLSKRLGDTATHRLHTASAKKRSR